MMRISTKGRPRVDDLYYRRLIAQAVLFKETERIVDSRKFGAYRANIVTFTIAKLVNATASRLDLDDIWKRQCVSPSLESAISDLCVPVQASITSPPGGANVGEWCKKPEAWTRVEAIRWDVPAGVTQELVNLRARRLADDEAAKVAAASVMAPEVSAAAAVPSQTWYECASWAKETNSLLPWQRGLAFSLGQRADRGTDPTAKQAAQGILLLQEAVRLGFRPQSPLEGRPWVGDG
jgi:hypothetical protein